MKRHVQGIRIALLAVAMIVVSACGTGGEAAAPTPSVTATAGPPKHQVGDKIDFPSQSVTLDSATVEGDILKATFTVTNNSTQPLILTTGIRATYAVSHGDLQPVEVPSKCPGKWTQLDPVKPGETKTGSSCFQGVTGDENIIVTYPDLLAGATGGASAMAAIAQWEVTR